MRSDSNTAGMNMEASEPGMVTPVIMADATGKRRIDPRGRVVGVLIAGLLIKRAGPLFCFVQSSGALPDQTSRYSVPRSVLRHPISYASRIPRGNRGFNGHLVHGSAADVLVIGAVRSQ